MTYHNEEAATEVQLDDGSVHNNPAGALMNNTTVAPATDIRCPIEMTGCTGEKHEAADTGYDGDFGWHSAFNREGEEWMVTVEWFSGDETWKVYGRLNDENEHLTADKVVGFYDAWIEARNIAHNLNAEVR
jgi:hypothetical protein